MKTLNKRREIAHQRDLIFWILIAAAVIPMTYVAIFGI